MAAAAALTWTREGWKWFATGRDGDRWHIAQAGSRRWEVYRDGALFADWPVTLNDAKWAAEEEDDPEARARARVRRERRAALRAARS